MLLYVSVQICHNMRYTTCDPGEGGGIGWLSSRLAIYQTLSSECMLSIEYRLASVLFIMGSLRVVSEYYSYPFWLLFVISFFLLCFPFLVVLPYFVSIMLSLKLCRYYPDSSCPVRNRSPR